jgi:hypothetical protein
VVLLAAFLPLAGPRERRLEIAAFAWVGLVSWTAIGQSRCYGVTSAFWGHFFGSARRE